MRMSGAAALARCHTPSLACLAACLASFPAARLASFPAARFAARAHRP